jgi:Tfp pilus assembly protein FimT
MEFRAIKMTSTIGKPGNNRRSRCGAFTLIELILVMALLIVAVSLVTPSLSKFFGGRSADSEARKFQALMRYGQSRAVSEGVPMMLWVDARNGTYGLESEPGYFDSDPRAVENKLDNGLRISVGKNTAKQPMVNSQTGRIQTGQAKQGKARLPAIYFLPDGTANQLTSAGSFSIQYSNNAPIVISPPVAAGGR